MSNDVYYSFEGKVLKRDDKDFIVAIWPDIPYYMALPAEYEKFMQKTMLPQFNYCDIEEYLHDIRFKQIFDYLQQINIVSECPISLEQSSDENPRKIYYVSLQVTEKCNLRCKHCYASAGQANYAHELTLEQWKAVITKIASFADVDRCIPIITGGEPLLRKDILDIIDYAMEKLKNVVIVTNSLLLTDQMIDALSKRKDLLIQVSLDGAKRETHEYIRGKNTFDRTISNIEKLVKSGAKVGLSPLCSEMFFQEIDDYFALAKRLGVCTVQLQPVQYIGRALTDKNIQRVDGDRLIKKVAEYYFSDEYHSLIQYGLESKSVIHVRNLNKLSCCGTGHGTMYICANGDIYSCPNMMHKKYVIGNVLKDDIENLYYNSPVYRELRSLNVNEDYDDECKTCEVKHFCGGGCRGVCIANTGNLHGKAIECAALKKYFKEIIWTICEKRDFYKEEATQWLREKGNMAKK